MKSIPDEHERKSDHDDHRDTGDRVPPTGVGVLAHQLMLVDEFQHKDQNQGQKDAVQDLREDAEFDQRKIRDQHDGRASKKEQAVEPVEKLCFTEALVEAAFDPQPLADGVCGRERKNGGGEEGGIDESSREDDDGVMAREVPPATT